MKDDSVSVCMAVDSEKDVLLVAGAPALPGMTSACEDLVRRLPHAELKETLSQVFSELRSADLDSHLAEDFVHGHADGSASGGVK